MKENYYKTEIDERNNAYKTPLCDSFYASCPSLNHEGRQLLEIENKTIKSF